jgi:Zn-finger nucleic acid-binding protein
MNCPNGHGALSEKTVGPVKLDICETCGGTWHDVGELRVLKDRESFGDYCWIDVDLWKHPEEFHVPDQRGLSCPRGAETLVTMRYGKTNVNVDACPERHGIWLEKGDYAEIIAELEKRVNTQSLREYARDLREEFLEIFSGPEGIVSEWKDMDRVLYLMQLRFGVEQPGIARIMRSLRL